MDYTHKDKFMRHSEAGFRVYFPELIWGLPGLVNGYYEAASEWYNKSDSDIKDQPPHRLAEEWINTIEETA